MIRSWLVAAAFSLGVVASSCAPAPPPEAGQVLDPSEADWLDPAPDRTLVDAEALRIALLRVSDQLAEVFPGEPARLPFPEIDRAFVPSGYDVTVLVGVTQTETMAQPENRCRFLRDTADKLAKLGWWIHSRTTEAIQTTYPLVSPGPHWLEGESSLGTFSLLAPAEGVYQLTYRVDADDLSADESQPQPANPPAITCE